MATNITNALMEQVAALQSQTAATSSAIDAAWIMSSAILIITMQAGFAVLESGFVSGIHSGNIFMKNLVDMGAGAVTFWAVGWAFIGGGDESGESSTWVGYDQFFVQDRAVAASWIFKFSFAATAATIVSGAVVGRIRFTTYAIISAVTAGVVYPFPGHWSWAGSGWLAKMDFFDFAGDGAIHMLGGIMGLVFTILMGPRIGVFGPNGEYKSVRSSAPNVLLGTFILWWGWFAFNAGSTGGVSGGWADVAGRAAMNTAVASGAGTSAALIASNFLGKGKTDVFDVAGATLGSLVAITGGCSVVYAWEAAIIGVVAVPISFASGRMLLKWKVDDPIGVFPVHYCCAVWGLIAVGLFAHEDDIVGNRDGLFHGGGWHLLGVEILGIVAITTWATLWAVALYFALEKTIGIRVSAEDELRGLDESEHRLPPAYLQYVDLLESMQAREGDGIASKKSMELSERNPGAVTSDNDAPLREEDTMHATRPAQDAPLNGDQSADARV